MLTLSHTRTNTTYHHPRSRYEFGPIWSIDNKHFFWLTRLAADRPAPPQSRHLRLHLHLHPPPAAVRPDPRRKRVPKPALYTSTRAESLAVASSATDNSSFVPRGRPPRFALAPFFSHPATPVHPLALEGVRWGKEACRPEIILGTNSAREGDRLTNRSPPK